MRSETEETGQAYITVSQETGDNLIYITAVPTMI
ncbi:Uncharacterised protein [Weissella viridescens]|uniref:Uncharacterized protein n=1 Tax=Weissella viridescens TaxID=1629 RepID=A0A380P196_WEIVI|nr:Uncharacterised protein [Weissella viridescens]